jgi:hypothetical protein
MALVAALGGCGGSLPDGADGGAGSGGAGAGSDGGDTLACGRMANPQPSDPLATTQWAMVTSWVGTATLPQGWTGQNPFGVEITFHADRTYRARSIDGSGQVPFYYDQNPDDGRFDLLLHSNGVVTGEIYLDGGMRADALSVLRFDALQTHLHIEYYQLGGYGPIVYELGCDPQADTTPWDMTPPPPPPIMDMAVTPADLAF